ncbi:hypothetical protein GCM10023145_04330 [Angustibacter luteus]
MPDVVAGLVNDGSAYSVARAAARQAAHRGGRVRFLQVAPRNLAEEDLEAFDRATFRSALRGLKGLNRVPCTFEVVVGDPIDVLVERSEGAALLVVGRDLPIPEHDVALGCQQRATCDVLTVFGV